MWCVFLFVTDRQQKTHRTTPQPPRGGLCRVLWNSINGSCWCFWLSSHWPNSRSLECSIPWRKKQPDTEPFFMRATDRALAANANKAACCAALFNRRFYRSLDSGLVVFHLTQRPAHQEHDVGVQRDHFYAATAEKRALLRIRSKNAHRLTKASTHLND